MKPAGRGGGVAGVFLRARQWVLGGGGGAGAARAGEHSIETVRDVPVSFSPERRTYEWRDVVETWVEIPAEIDAAADGPEGSGAALDDLPATRGAGSGPPARPSTPDAFDELS